LAELAESSYNLFRNRFKIKQPWPIALAEFFAGILPGSAPELW
jgi:hypothetical protein